jgi:hypothetical protein
MPRSIRSPAARRRHSRPVLEDPQARKAEVAQLVARALKVLGKHPDAATSRRAQALLKQMTNSYGQSSRSL